MLRSMSLDCFLVTAAANDSDFIYVDVTLSALHYYNYVTRFGKIRLNVKIFILPAESMMPEDRILQV